MTYYKEDIRCKYNIIDNVLYYTDYHGRVFSREMCDEIDIIINTYRYNRLKDNRISYMKIIYENELISINHYLRTSEPFKLMPPYRRQIVRWHGEIPNNHKNPNYYSDECIKFYLQCPDKCEAKMLKDIKAINKVRQLIPDDQLNQTLKKREYHRNRYKEYQKRQSNGK